ncbi:hypothetical protein EIN_153210 [Entamoeba invadens IP1]|uniref:Uncharacterized protein n=1 Tax=Entamoeba invadens IP1 TaxID=370355 RepID=A0A0A1U8T4_ENTIV|nr:hypothetical protein EIN_153210 [Entamoeba invadens IP1]ELP91314.1 hypothetical protein EIN_153210 [Entamoeba invadens IP1]|eukprot:XP_004258085.1 hypothetical protein EIN_153210 [Entamoeba invadens IP1]
MESRKHGLEGDILVPELKKRVIDMTCEPPETKEKYKPCVIEMGALPRSSDLLASRFLINDSKIAGKCGDTLVFKQISDVVDYMNYAIGIRKKGTTDLTILPVEHYTLKQQIKSDEPEEFADQGSFAAKKLELNINFGTSRPRINTMLRNMMNKAVGTHDIVREDVTLPESGRLVLNPIDYPDLPFFNPSTTVVEEVYPIDHIFSADELEYFNAYSKEARNKLKGSDMVVASETLEKIKKTKFGNYYGPLLTSMDKKRLPKVLGLLEAYRILYLLATRAKTLRFNKNYVNLASAEDLSQDILVSLADKYYEKVLDEKTDQVTYDLTNLLKTKLVNTAIVLALNVTGFTLSSEMAKLIAVDFQVSNMAIISHLSRVGCKGSFITQDGKKDNTFVLNAPLNIPSLTKKNKKK